MKLTTLYTVFFSALFLSGCSNDSGGDGGMDAGTMVMVDTDGGAVDGMLRFLDAQNRQVDMATAMVTPDAGPLANACIEPPAAPPQRVPMEK